MKTRHLPLVDLLHPSRAMALFVVVALSTAACEDDTGGAGGSGGDDGTTSTAATQASTATSTTTAGSGGDAASSHASSGGDASSGGGLGEGGTDEGGAGGGGVGEGGAGDGGDSGDGGDGGTGEGGAGTGGTGGAGDGGASSACLEISGGEFALLASGNGVFTYQGPSTVGIDGPDPDMIRLDLFGEDATGDYELGFSTGQSPQTCEACLWVYADYVEVVQKAFFVDRGTLELGSSTPPNIAGRFVDVTLVEVEIDFDVFDFVPVEGGACLHLDEMAFDVEMGS
jgi:hypothetical protein